MTHAMPPLTDLALRRMRVEKAISALERNEQIVVVNDLADREICGFLVAGAAHVDAAAVASVVRYSSGFVCVALSGDTCDRLDLPVMEGVDEKSGTGSHACVTVDATTGTTTGISAHDRARTAALLADPRATRDDFTRPGHVVPVRTAEDGLRARQGIAEAASFLSERSGRGSAALFAAAVGESVQTGLPHRAELEAFATAHRLSLVSISDVHLYMLAVTPVVNRESAARLLGQQVITYVGPTSQARHHVTVVGPTDTDAPVPLYVHPESVETTDDPHGFEEVERAMVSSGSGIIIHVQADREPDRRLDKLPFVVASILGDLGVHSVRLLNGDGPLRAVLRGREIELCDAPPIAAAARWDERALHAS
ncbi:hypothetical protein GKZ92_20465 [Gordonia sp. 135]|uniref:3,4-dihydroxy-2-butanone-4-phosphate synthase n=1 Tax=Gordonia sp. 135 TaxID=2676309 RepID=UPI0012BB3E40|nr:3,4-dihydroxy-2-butanone-4-phosphate synthase [Gordonia sp. 135]QGP89797.1 hypothetical protein GKZ92_20465 [Gordonia sp. 135]